MLKNKIKNKRVHLIGICGKGMSALALMFQQKGYYVTGSDEGFYDPIASLLTKNKIKITVVIFCVRITKITFCP